MTIPIDMIEWMGTLIFKYVRLIDRMVDREFPPMTSHIIDEIQMNSS